MRLSRSIPASSLLKYTSRGKNYQESDTLSPAKEHVCECALGTFIHLDKHIYSVVTGSLPPTENLYGKILRLVETFTEQGDLDAAAECIETCTKLLATDHTDVSRCIVTCRVYCLPDA
jgi:hypothetical protein